MKRKESSSDFIVKLVVFLGAIAAIFVAISTFTRNFNKKLADINEDSFDFDDEDFIDDCDLCDAESCEGCEFAEDEPEIEIEIDEIPED